MRGRRGLGAGSQKHGNDGVLPLRFVGVKQLFGGEIFVLATILSDNPNPTLIAESVQQRGNPVYVDSRGLGNGGRGKPESVFSPDSAFQSSL